MNEIVVALFAAAGSSWAAAASLGQQVAMEWLSQITEVITALAALTGATLGIINRRRISEVHVSINSRMDELLKATGVAAHAEGLEQGRKESDGP